MVYNVLSSSAAAQQSNPWGSWVIMGLLVVFVVAFMVYNTRAQKKRQQETMDMLNALKPGNKVKTIGGICGVVVEVCPDDNTFVLETGTEASGKSYIKFDKQAVYQTDAVAEKAPVQEVAEAPAAENTEDAAESNE